MNRQELISKIKQLEGLTDDERAELVNLLNTDKKYGLIWEDKPEDVEEQLRTQLPVLREVIEKRILASPGSLEKKETEKTTEVQQSLFETDDSDSSTPEASPSGRLGGAPNHILIEGDNLHALTALTFTHEGQIDVIYIDPPYNTGNKDFKYNDAFVDKEDSYRHSKWLSFMHKRLEIAKRLLSDKGVIFISIDDNEQAQLKLLCDSIFGELNCIGPIIQNKQNAKNDTINVQKNHEYILIYRKICQYSENKKIIPNLINVDFKTKNVYEEDGLYYYLNDAITTRGDGGILNARSNLGHTIYYNPDTKDKIAVCDYDIELAKTSNDLNTVYSIDSELISKGYVAIRPPKVRGKLGCWTWSKEKINEEKNDLVITGKVGTYAVKKRTFVDKNEVYEEKGKLFFNSYVESNSRSILDYSTNDGTDALNEILNSPEIFNNPKNVDMLRYLLGLVPIKNSAILDFFAGSGTTLHATIQLNAKDGGNRQCILVTNNENNICEEVTYERNKRVIQGYTNAKGVQVAGLANNNLRYFRSEYVGREKTHKNKRELVLAATELLCIKEDIYTELAELNGQKLDKKTIRCFSDKGRYLMVIYDEETIETLLPLISAIDTHHKIKIYIFAPGQYPFTEEFEDVLDKVELCALPDAIYKAYANVLPKKKAKSVENSDEESTETGENKEPNLFTE